MDFPRSMSERKYSASFLVSPLSTNDSANSDAQYSYTFRKLFSSMVFFSRSNMESCTALILERTARNASAPAGSERENTFMREIAGLAARSETSSGDGASGVRSQSYSAPERRS